MIAPGPRGAFLLGSLPLARQDPLRMIREAVRDHGDLVRLTFPVGIAHLTRDPEHIKEVLSDSAGRFSKQTRGWDNLRLLIGNGLLTSEGDTWLRQRRIAQPAFHKQRVAAFTGPIGRAAAELLDGWTDGQRLDAAEEMMRVTLRIAGETLLGKDPSADAAVVEHALTSVLFFIKRRALQLFPLSMRWPTPANRRFLAARARLDAVIYALIAERKARPGGNDLLSTLLEARDELTGEGLSALQLRDEVMTMFLAGHETTANALSWALYAVARAPAVRERLEQEVDALGRPPSPDDLGRLTYTRRVIDETLRLFPPVWMIPRRIEADCELGGYALPARTLLLLSVYAAHRHPAHWERPEEFDPDRFLPEPSAARPRHAYLPFGGGPHQCIGNGLALLQMQLVLAAVAQRFRLELIGPGEIAPEPLVTLRPLGGVPVRVRRR